MVTLEALEAFRVNTPLQDPQPLEYLQFDGNRNFDIELEVALQTPNQNTYRISSTNYSYMYWNLAQQIAHHTINGCNLKVGDLLASGTISGPTHNSCGSMLELTYGGRQPIKLDFNQQRTFLEDGDVLTIKGFSQKDGLRVGFGEVSGKILAAN